MNKRRGSTGFFRYLRETKDSDLVVVFGENSAAVLGLALAGISLIIAKQTHDGRWDGIGSLAIGVVLVVVALFLAIEVKSLLVGESADPVIDKAVRESAAADARLLHLISLITIQQGPGEVLVVTKISFRPDLSTNDVAAAINEFEARLRAKCPEVRWCYVEPDLHKPAIAA